MKLSGMEQFFLIAGMCIVTCLPRILPLTFLSKLQFSPLMQKWLALVAPAIFAALLAPSLWFVYKPSVDGLIHRDYTVLLAAIPAAVLGWKTQNFLLTMLTGMISCALLRHFELF